MLTEKNVVCSEMGKKNNCNNEMKCCKQIAKRMCTGSCDIDKQKKQSNLKKENIHNSNQSRGLTEAFHWRGKPHGLLILILGFIKKKTVVGWKAGGLKANTTVEILTHLQTRTYISAQTEPLRSPFGIPGYQEKKLATRGGRYAVHPACVCTAQNTDGVRVRSVRLGYRTQYGSGEAAMLVKFSVEELVQLGPGYFRRESSPPPTHTQKERGPPGASE